MRDGEMSINAKIFGGLLQNPPMPWSVNSEGSTSAGPLCSPLFLPLPFLQQVEVSPQLPNEATLALVSKTKGGQDQVGE